MADVLGLQEGLHSPRSYASSPPDPSSPEGVAKLRASKLRAGRSRSVCSVADADKDAINQAAASLRASRMAAGEERSGANASLRTSGIDGAEARAGGTSRGGGGGGEKKEEEEE